MTTLEISLLLLTCLAAVSVADPYPNTDKPLPPDPMEQRKVMDLHSALSLIDSDSLKNILLKAPIKETLCKISTRQFARLIKWMPFDHLKGGTDKDIKYRICRDTNFYKKMKELDSETLKWVILSIENIEECLRYLNPSLIDEIISSALQKVAKPASKSALDDPHIVNELFTYMPNVPYYLANSLIDVKCGFIRFSMEHHENLEHLLPYMDAKNLNHVIRCYPNLGKPLSRFTPQNLRKVLTNIQDLVGFLNNISDHLAKLYLMKLPELAPLLEDKASKAALKVLNILGPEHLAYLRTNVPNIVKILERMDSHRLLSLKKRMPTVIDALNTMSDDEKTAINAKVDTILDLMDTLGVEAVIKLAKPNDSDRAFAFLTLLL